MDEWPSSVGTVESMCELEIRDENDNVVEDGEVGEICIRGAVVFLGNHETVAKADECESAALRAFRVESLKNMCRIPAANGIRRLSFRPPQGVAYSHVQG